MQNRRIRVLRVIARMNVGGPAIQITGLMQNLSTYGFDQLLLTGYCDRDEIDYLDEKEIRLSMIRLNGFGRRISVLADFKTFFEIRKVIKAFDPDIVHTHTAKAGFLGRLAAISTFKRRLKVHTYHGHLLQGYFSKVKTKFVILIESFLARYTDSLVAVGDKVRDELLEANIGNPQKFSVIGPGIEISNLTQRSLALRAFGLPLDKMMISWIGRAVSIKAPHRLIEVAKECTDRRLDVHFVFVGEGPMSAEMKEKAEYLSLPITFLGWQTDIEKILSFSDLVMLTSLNEGTPVALIQAQLAGVPVLTTNVGSASEVLINEKSGYCLDYSVKEFTDRIELLSKNPELRNSFGIAGQRYAQEKFSLHQLVTRHSALYRQLVNQSMS
jgi:glycosyltransferase involved in cell wall biosynthesis